MSGQPSLQYQLEKGFAALGLQVSVDPFLEYLYLLAKWNQVYNLTAVRSMNLMVERHILDSLAVLPWIRGQRLLDVGSGAGLPGIPLALISTDRAVVLLDSNGKKVRFLQEVKRQLQLTNVEVVYRRAESYQPSQGFDTVISRALSDLEQMMSWTEHLINRQGVWIAMKGRYPEAELWALGCDYWVQPYSVPGLKGERCCVIIEKEKS